jgi:hypothetical protein
MVSIKPQPLYSGKKETSVPTGHKAEWDQGRCKLGDKKIYPYPWRESNPSPPNQTLITTLSYPDSPSFAKRHWRHGRNEGTALHILKFGTRWRLGGQFHVPTALHPEMSLGFQSNWRLSGPYIWWWTEKKILSLPGIEHMSCSHNDISQLIR